PRPGAQARSAWLLGRADITPPAAKVVPTRRVAGPVLQRKQCNPDFAAPGRSSGPAVHHDPAWRPGAEPGVLAVLPIVAIGSLDPVHGAAGKLFARGVRHSAGVLKVHLPFECVQPQGRVA